MELRRWVGNPTPPPRPQNEFLVKILAGVQQPDTGTLTYRGKPHVGGQGVYTRHLTKALVDLGHHVEVLSGLDANARVKKPLSEAPTDTKPKKP